MIDCWLAGRPAGRLAGWLGRSVSFCGVWQSTIDLHVDFYANDSTVHLGAQTTFLGCYNLLFCKKTFFGARQFSVALLAIF